jgi:putative inorganic carbon (hco3(-)) transporter
VTSAAEAPRVSGSAGRLQLPFSTLLASTILLLVVASLGRIPLLSTGGKEAPILANDIFIAIALSGAAVVVLRRRSAWMDRTMVLAALFAAWALLSTLTAIPRFELSAYEFAFSVAYLVRWVFYFALYAAVVNLITRADLPRIWSALEAMILVFAGFGIVQAVLLPDFAQLVYPESTPYLDWDIQGHRLVSTFLDPNFAGVLIAIGLLVLLSRMAFGASVSWWKPLLLLVALTLTLSRGAILSFAVGLLVVMMVRGNSRRLIRFGGAAVLAVLPLLPLLFGLAVLYNKLSFGDASALTRVFGWLLGLEMLADHPILGVGFNTFGFALTHYGGEILGSASFGIDGGLLFIAVMTGLVGALIYSLILLSVFDRCRAVWKDRLATPEERGIALGAGASVVVMVVNSLFVNSIIYPFLLQVVWILWALPAVVRLHDPEHAA